MDALELLALQKQQSEDYNKYMQDMTLMIKGTMMRIKGEREERDEATGKATYIKEGEAMANKDGVNFVESKLQAYLNPNTYMSKLKPDEAANNYKVEGIGFMYSLRAKKTKFGLSKENLISIYRLVMPIIYFALMKSCSDKDFIQNTTNTGYMNRSADQQASAQMPQ